MDLLSSTTVRAVRLLWLASNSRQRTVKTLSLVSTILVLCLAWPLTSFDDALKRHKASIHGIAAYYSLSYCMVLIVSTQPGPEAFGLDYDSLQYPCCANCKHVDLAVL